MAKPRIAITTWRRQMPTFLSDRTDLYTLAVEYAESISDAGGLPVLLPQHRAEDARAVLRGMDGLVLVGGGDVDPARYGASDSGMNRGVSAAADESDIAFVLEAVDLGKPVFGICRGCQVVNVAMGGTLYQDVTSPDGVHRPISSDPTEIANLRHVIRMTVDSRLAAAYGDPTERLVNSVHHQGIDAVAPGFRAVAWAEDGLVEAIEPEDPSTPVLAVQWHPEKIVGEGDQALFDYFITEMVGA